MDQHSQASKVGGAANAADTPAASYALTPFLQGVPMESVPSSSAGASFLPFSASQCSYPSAMQLLSNQQQPPQTDPFEAATNDAAYALTALTTYNHQPEALASVTPSSSAGTTFLPAAASQGAPTTAYQAAIPSALSSQQQAALLQKFQQQQQQQQQQYQQQQLQAFWTGQLVEAEQATDLKVNLPLARIKKIMRADEDVKMIAAEAPVVFAKACEMFILELTLRSWLQTEGTKRRTMQRSDVAAAIMANEMFDFLMDVTPEQQAANGDGVLPPQPPPQTATAGQVPFPMHVPFPMYANQQPPFMWPTPEYLQQQPPQQQQNPGGGGQNE